MEQTARISRRKRKKALSSPTRWIKLLLSNWKQHNFILKYGKVITRKKKIYAHTDENNLNIGDVVEVVETRPLSKLKRWRVVQKA